MDVPQKYKHKHNVTLSLRYEIVGQDDWAKLERQISNTSNPKITIDGLTPYTKYVMRVKVAYNGRKWIIDPLNVRHTIRLEADQTRRILMCALQRPTRLSLLRYLFPDLALLFICNICRIWWWLKKALNSSWSHGCRPIRRMDPTRTTNCATSCSALTDGTRYANNFYILIPIVMIIRDTI